VTQTRQRYAARGGPLRGYGGPLYAARGGPLRGYGGPLRDSRRAATRLWQAGRYAAQVYHTRPKLFYEAQTDTA
jgi:hypothetical protein